MHCEGAFYLHQIENYYTQIVNADEPLRLGLMFCPHLQPHNAKQKWLSIVPGWPAGKKDRKKRLD
jgi:hypothetical protein